MVTFTEIKQAVAILPLSEQEELYRSLDERLHRRGQHISVESREAWLTRLALLRNQTQAVLHSGPDSTEILNELRIDFAS